MAERGHPDHDVDERIGAISSPLGATLRPVAVLPGGRHLRRRPARQRRDRRHAVLAGGPAPRAAVGPAHPAAPRRGRGGVAGRRGPAGHGAGAAGRRGPDRPARAAPRHRPAAALVRGGGPRRGAARAAAHPARRRASPPCRSACRWSRPSPARRGSPAGTSSSPAGTASTPSSWSRAEPGAARLRASSSSSGSSAAPCPASSTAAWRRASGPRPSAGSAATGRSSTCTSPSSTARRTRSTPPTPPSRPPARWPCASSPPPRARGCSSRGARSRCVVPAEYVGAVMSDLSGRRARVTGSEADPDRDRTTVRAEVPEVELLTYPGVLRSVTHGTGSFSRRPLGYEPAPASTWRSPREDGTPPTPGRPGPAARRGRCRARLPGDGGRLASGTVCSGLGQGGSSDVVERAVGGCPVPPAPADGSPPVLDREDLPDRVWTLPNALSVLRLLGVPLFLWLLLGPGGRRLGAGRPHGLGLHRLARRQARPVAEPEQPARRAARPGRRPALHRLHAGRAGAARDRARAGWWPCWSAASSCSASRCSSCASYGYPPLQVHYLGKAATLLLLYAFPVLLIADGRGLAGRRSPSRSPGPSRSGARPCTCWPGLLYVVQVVGIVRAERGRPLGTAP